MLRSKPDSFEYVFIWTLLDNKQWHESGIPLRLQRNDHLLPKLVFWKKKREKKTGFLSARLCGCAYRLDVLHLSCHVDVALLQLNTTWTIPRPSGSNFGHLGNAIFCFRNCLLPGTPTISFAFTKWCFCTSIRFGLLSLKGNFVPMTSMWSAKKSLFLFTCFIFAGLSLYFEDGHDDLDDCKYLTSEKKVVISED